MARAKLQREAKHAQKGDALSVADHTLLKTAPREASQKVKEKVKEKERKDCRILYDNFSEIFFEGKIQIL